MQQQHSGELSEHQHIFSLQNQEEYADVTPGGSRPQIQNALQDLLEILRSPSSLEQQKKILQILKSNPQLMAAFIKQRQMCQMQQQTANSASSANLQQKLHPNTVAQHHQNTLQLQGLYLGSRPIDNDYSLFSKNDVENETQLGETQEKKPIEEV